LKPEQTGLAFTNVLFEFSGATNRILHNGAGVALGDYDQDGLLDISFAALTAQARFTATWVAGNSATSLPAPG